MITAHTLTSRPTAPARSVWRRSLSALSIAALAAASILVGITAPSHAAAPSSGHGTFSLATSLIDPDKLIPADTRFTVAYTVAGEKPVEVELTADGSPVPGPTLPTGTIVTFDAITLPVIDHVVWEPPMFTPGDEITIGDGTTIAVTVENSFTEISSNAPAIRSHAYVGDAPNSTLSEATSHVVDVIRYVDLREGMSYRLIGTLVYLDNGELVDTGISSEVEFLVPGASALLASLGTEAGPDAQGSVDVPFELTPEEVLELAGKRIFIFQSLETVGGQFVAQDRADDADDTWFDETDGWFLIAATETSELAATGTQPILVMLVASTAVLVGVLIMLVAAVRHRRLLVSS